MAAGLEAAQPCFGSASFINITALGRVTYWITFNESRVRAFHKYLIKCNSSRTGWAYLMRLEAARLGPVAFLAQASIMWR
jgi:hypothetical protein